MISKEEIKKLADLARIEVKEEEIENLRGEIDSILDYLDQIKSVGDLSYDKDNLEVGPVFNVWREDAVPTTSRTYSKELIAEFPDKEGDYLKVKKIL